MAPRLILCLIIFLVGKNALAGLSIDIKPIWDGKMRSGKNTEIVVTIASPYSTTLQLVLANDKYRITTATQVDAGRIKREWITVLPTTTQPLQISAYENGIEVYKTELRTEPLPKTGLTIAIAQFFTALTRESASLQKYTNIEIIQPRHDDLPRGLQAYGHIDSLIIDTKTLQTLDARQFEAVLAFSSNCGLLFTLNMPANVFDAIRNHAGCGQKNVRNVTSIDAAINAIMSNPRPYTPTVLAENEIDILGENYFHVDTKRNMAILVCVYFILIAMAGLTKKLFAPVLVLLCSAGFFLWWFDRPPHVSQTILAEMYGNDTIARYIALLEVDGRGRYKVRTDLPPKATLPVKLGHSQHTEDVYITETSLQYRIHHNTHLLSISQYMTYGIYQGKQPFGIHWDGSALVVTNDSNIATSPAVLMWKNDLYSVPTIQPGSTWSPEFARSEMKNTRIESFFKRYTKNDTAALLIRNDQSNSSLNNRHPAQHNWLLVRYGMSRKTI